jgi:peptidoglycan/xylan/chitin deacetylase (PgdA/CDA1 family)
MPPARFKAQIDYLSRHCDVVPLDEGLAQLEQEDNSTPSRPQAAITIDDGYGDNFEHLLPLVQAACIPVTIFLATDYIDTGRLPWPTRVSALLHFATRSEVTTPTLLLLTSTGKRGEAGHQLREHMSRLDHDEREAMFEELEDALAPRPFEPLRPLSWDEVRIMQADAVRFGAHTCFHGWLDRVSMDDVEAELGPSRARIEAETGKPCEILAYPNGNWNADVADAAARAGFRFALTQDAGINRRKTLNPLALHRIEVPFDERIGTFACRVGGVAL